MNPYAMPNSSFKIFAMGARQFVVQLAFDTILCFSASKMLSFTPMQIVTSGSFAGALINTRFAPALLKCRSDFSRLVKNAGDFVQTTPANSLHGRFAGTR